MSRRIIALLVSLLILFGLVAVPSAAPTEASEVQNENSNSAKQEKLEKELEDLQNQYEQLEGRQAELESLIANATSLKNQQIALRNSIEEQIEITETKIQLLEDKITLLDDTIEELNSTALENEAEIEETMARIAEKEAAIEEKQSEYDKTYENFRKRLRALYMQGDKTELELLFSAESYSDMLTAIENQKRLAKYDTDQMTDIVLQKQSLEQSLADIEEDKSDLIAIQRELDRQNEELDARRQELADSSAEIEAARAELEQQRAAADALVGQYAAQEEQANQEQAKILQSMKQYKEQMNEYFRQLTELSQMKEYVGGVFQWPLPGYTTITSYFGEQRSYYSGGQYITDVHTGTDISGSGVYGKPIVAANSGVVYMANWTSTGYGNYVIIDHGGGYSTLYGHCSSLAVQAGQTVMKGDVIAYVGSTGNSTGPHLHFEVRVNNTAVDPMQFFQ